MSLSHSGSLATSGTIPHCYPLRVWNADHVLATLKTQEEATARTPRASATSINNKNKPDHWRKVQASPAATEPSLRPRLTDDGKAISRNAQSAASSSAI